MSLEDILEIERSRVKRDRVLLTTIYDRMKNRINMTVKAKNKECIYTIPPFIIGYPPTDLDKTRKYLVKKLIREGFIAGVIDRENIYISWDPQKIRQLHELTIRDFDYSDTDIGTGYSVTGLNTNKKIVEKEIERVNDNFINQLVISKRKDNLKS
jgi:uncharacterized protein YlxP (DUF503 family)